MVQFIRSKSFGDIDILILLISVGLGIRLFFVFSSAFPLNDGGLFYEMIVDLKQNRFMVPAYTYYNTTAIPFAYPPLTFYIAAVLSFIWPLVEIIRFLPLIISTFTIPVFYVLSKEMLKDTYTHPIAGFIFAVLPRSFEWFIMGGGLTRSFGFLLGLLAILYAYRFYQSHKRKSLVLSTFFVGLSILSHLEYALFALCSILLLCFFYAKTRNGILGTVVILIGGAILSSPWWITVVLRHGFSPFIAAAHTINHSFFSLWALFSFAFTQEIFLGLFSVLGMVGIVFSILKKQLFLPVWLLLIFVLDTRSASTLAIVPFAMLAGIGFFHLFSVKSEDRIFKKVYGYMLGIVGIYSLLTIILSYEVFGSTLQALSLHDIAAMEWVQNNTPASAQFLVLTPWLYEAWSIDRVAEWFPVLAARQSMTTVQGKEWIANDTFNATIALNKKLKECYVKDISCVERWAERTGGFTHIYLYKPLKEWLYYAHDVAFLRLSLQKSSRYLLVYDNPGATIWLKK